MLADRVNRLQHSPTLRIAALAGRMRAEGVDVLDFSVGQPDFPTPSVAKEAGKRAIDENRTGYTASEGIPELRAAIADKLRRDNRLTYEPSQILVSPGAKATLYFLAMSLWGTGDEVLIPSPYWVSYPEQVGLADAKAVFVPTDESEGFKLSPAALQAAVTPRTKAVILNYPSNPTGACYDGDELAGLARVCLERGLTVVSDEIYEKLIYDGRTFVSIASLGDAIKARTVVVNGLSKSYSMTGWRLGYAAGPPEIIDAMSKIQSHSTSNPTSIAQWAGLEALRLADDEVESMRRAFEERRDTIVRRLEGVPGVSCAPPVGAFYAFPNVSALFGSTPTGAPETASGSTLESALDVADYLLREARVAVVPGEAFGSRDHIRLSYACSISQIEEGMDRIAAAVAALR